MPFGRVARCWEVFWQGVRVRQAIVVVASGSIVVVERLPLPEVGCQVRVQVVVVVVRGSVGWVF